MSEITPSEVVWPITVLLASLASIAAALGFKKRSPPVPEEMAKKYVRKPELAAAIKGVHDRMDRELVPIRDETKELKTKIDTLITTTNRSAIDTATRLGRIEGKINAHLKENHND